MIIVARIIVSILLLALILFCRRQARILAKTSMYSYRLVSILGLIIFLSGCLFAEILRIINNIRYIDQLNPDFMMDLFSGATSVFTSLVYLAFIPAALFSIFLLVANIVLLIKEGRSLRNILGIVLGAVLILGSFATFDLYLIMDQFMDVHSYAGYHISLVAENIFAIFVVYFECMMLATIYVAFKTMRHQPKFDKTHIIVLGCQVRQDGMPGGVLRKRVEAAIKFAKAQEHTTGTAPTLIFSGGKGNDEPISEAKSMQKYVAAQHYDGKILLEEKSTTTHENFKFSKQIAKNSKHIAFATTDFHVFRSGVFASQLGFRGIEGIGAKSPWYFYYNALIREYIANLNTERKMHAFNIINAILVTAIIIAISYFFKIM